MEEWELSFEWLHLCNKLKELMGYATVPDIQAVLLLIGVQELGKPKEDYTKEEKRDLMHIAVCRLLSDDGHYEFEGFDADGWPHYKLIKPIAEVGVKSQEQRLKQLAVGYFREIFPKED